jgi:hypothetical protein
MKTHYNGGEDTMLARGGIFFRVPRPVGPGKSQSIQ